MAGEYVRGMPVIQSSSIALAKVLRNENRLKKQNEHKIRYRGRPLPQYHSPHRQLHSRKSFHVISRQSSTAWSSTPVMPQLMKRNSFPRSGNTIFHNKASRPAVSALGFNKRWTSQTLRQPYAYLSKRWPWPDLAGFIVTIRLSLMGESYTAKRCK